jgi:hypothetical protein
MSNLNKINLKNLIKYNNIIIMIIVFYKNVGNRSIFLNYTCHINI